MKKLLQLAMISTLFLSLVFAFSCSDDTPLTPTPEPDPEYTTLSSTKASTYYGDNMEKGTGTFTTSIYSGDLDVEGKPTTDMVMINLLFCSDIAVDAEKALPSIGTYSVGDGAFHTFLATELSEGVYSNTLLTTYDKATDTYTYLPIVGGTFAIIKSDVVYTITTSLIDDKGATHKYTYTGALKFDNASIPPMQHDEMTQATLTYFRDIYNTRTGNFVMSLTNKPLGDGELPSEGVFTYYLDFISTLSPDNFEAIPENGEYQIAEGYQEFTLIPGVKDEYGAVTGTSVFSFYPDDLTFTDMAIVEGKFSILRTGSDYVVTTQLIDESGLEHNREYTGPIEVINSAGPNQLKKDLDVTEFSMVESVLLGGPPFMKMWILNICGKGVTVAGGNITGSGHTFLLNLCVSVGDGADPAIFPEGTYVAKKEEMVEGTFVKGDRKNSSGSLYTEYKDGVERTLSAIVDGQVRVINAGDIYTVILQTTNEIGYDITATYVGEFTPHDIQNGTNSEAYQYKGWQNKQSVTTPYRAKQEFVSSLKAR